MFILVILFFNFFIYTQDSFYDGCYSVKHSKKKEFSLKNYSSGARKKYTAIRLLYTKAQAALKKPRDARVKTQIPKIIHQIWLGPKPLPKQHAYYRASWLKHNPDWEYKLWRDKDLEDFPFINKKAFDTATNPGEKSDIWRYMILYLFGGLYADDDFECCASFDHLHETYSFYAGIEPVGEFSISNALIGSAQGNKLLLYCLEHIHHENDFKNGIKEILARTGPVYFADCIFKNLAYVADFGGIIFPTNYFYPVPFGSRHETTREKEKLLTKDSLAIHHWGGSWKERKK